jgi:LytS/YehU family sensor histidine kinase
LAIAVLDPALWDLQPWVEALAPLRFSRGDAYGLALGSRTGGRRYLSEDIEVLERLATIVSEQVERIRNSEMQALVSQAELRALQAQINPHFLFNALNTLYGSISRENVAARNLVLNLAGLFRYSFAQNPGLIQISEELVIVRAYLAIEELRLGSKLRSEIEVDDEVLEAKVPVLSIQPLVENAIKHGVAVRQTPGFVRICIKRHNEEIGVEISNSGPFRYAAGGSPAGRTSEAESNGVGLANVRRRLTLCYGNENNLEISSTNDVTVVRFSIPAARLFETIVH